MPNPKKQKKDVIVTLRFTREDSDKYKKEANECNISLSNLLSLRIARDNVVISPDLADVARELYLIRLEVESGKLEPNTYERIDELCQYCESLRGRFRTYQC